MLAFLFGVVAGVFTGVTTYHSTALVGPSIVVGVIVFLVGWLLGVFFFGDASDIDF